MILIAIAGILGATGVALAALAAHVNDSIALRAAAEIAMVNAVACVAVCAIANHAGRPALFRTVAGAMLLGAWLFSGTVALGILADWRPLPSLAPIGGTLTIAAWLGLAVVAAVEWLAPPRP